MNQSDGRDLFTHEPSGSALLVTIMAASVTVQRISALPQWRGIDILFHFSADIVCVFEPVSYAYILKFVPQSRSFIYNHISHIFGHK
jgi:hypothetical protein